MTNDVYNMDCMEYMRTLPDKAFQLAIADPPYGVSYARGKNGYGVTVDKLPTHDDVRWDDKIPDPTFFSQLLRVSENVIIWGANYYPQFLSHSMGWVVWDKGQHGLTMSDGELAYTSFERALRIVTINRGAIAQDGAIHPTQKPVALYAWLLKNYAKPGDRIFDPMMGSQSSRIAAYKLGFDYVGCELDKEYFDKGCERFNRECKGEIKTKDGHIIKQTTLW